MYQAKSLVDFASVFPLLGGRGRDFPAMHGALPPPAQGGKMIASICASSSTLIVEVPGRLCALPVRQVIETMRPLAVEPVAGAPSFVRGVAIIRGIPTPVVDLGALLGTPSDVAERFVTLRVRNSQVALSVNGVLGVRDLDRGARVQPLPPLLQNASKDIVQMLGTLDEELLMVLRDGWELPEGVWQTLLAEERVL